MTPALTSTMTPELYWTIVTALFTACLWAPHILQRIIEMKPYAAFRDPLHDRPTQAPWAQRANKAHTNAVENLIVFGLFAITLHILGAGTELTAQMSALYFASRVGHYIVYVFGVPWARTPLFLIGWACQLVLGGTLLSLI